MKIVTSTSIEYLLFFISIGLLFIPIIVYLFTGWVAKRREILSSFSEDTIEEYFKVFFRDELETENNLKDVFSEHYHKRFGRQHFITPLVLLFVISSFLLAIVSGYVSSWLDQESTGELNFPLIVITAIAGAYMWVVHDFISRVRRHDLCSSDIFWASFRFIIAPPLAISLSVISNEDFGPAFGFILGVFPTRTLITITRRLAMAKFNLSGFAEESIHESKKLQGVGKTEAERFEAEGVANILQLAYSDPIELTIRTNFSFSYVADCCSQALAWIYLQDELSKIRKYGIRGAQEITNLVDEIDEGKGVAKSCLQLIATEMEIDAIALEFTMREIAEDPYTKLLCNAWCVE